MSLIKIAYDPTLDDDEWREVNFSEDQIEGARSLGASPSVDKLLSHARRFGTDGIRESGIMLTQGQYRRLERGLIEIEKEQKGKKK